MGAPVSNRLADRMQRGDVFAPRCPSREVLKHVTSTWGVLVLIALRSGTLRFSELRRKAAGVSERALRYAFEELVGISPVRYLSMLRLCEACRSLSSADAGRKSVKSIALSCGLWDLSRFADSYRKVFGELPSETLMRGNYSPA